jgi:hypothetical protein
VPPGPDLPEIASLFYLTAEDALAEAKAAMRAGLFESREERQKSRAGRMIRRPLKPPALRLSARSGYLVAAHGRPPVVCRKAYTPASRRTLRPRRRDRAGRVACLLPFAGPDPGALPVPRFALNWTVRLFPQPVRKCLTRMSYITSSASYIEPT